VRTAFLILLAANLAFFAWSQYFSGSQAAANGVLARASDPDKLKIVPPPAAKATTSTGCLEWGGFTLAESNRAEKALEPLGLGPKPIPRRTEQTASWWVFIPSQGSRQAALKKAAELKAIGITDYFIMGEEGDAPWSLSLGIYRSEQAALTRLSALRDQGVRTALVGSRDTVYPRIWLQVKGIDATGEARLREIARELEGSELRPCP
jgi:hypothetical protein